MKFGNFLHKHEESTKTYNTYITAIENTGFIVSSLLAVLNKAIEFLKKNPVISDYLNQNHSVFAKIINLIDNYGAIYIILFIVFVFILVLGAVKSCLRSRTMSYHRQKDLANFIHIKLIHDIRYKIVELENINNRLEKYAHDNDIKSIEKDYIIELDNLKRTLCSYIDSLSVYLSQYRDDNISVCIKLFSKRDRRRTDFLNERIITIARSSNTKEIRTNDDNTIVGNNTDFANLCNGQSIFFGCANLSEKESAGLYCNDSTNWEKGLYNSTLVAPIRYNAKDSKSSNNTVKPDIIGFLCIDSKKNVYEWENQDSFELQLLAIFADSLYIYIKEFYECYEKIGYIK